MGRFFNRKNVAITSERLLEELEDARDLVGELAADVNEAAEVEVAEGLGRIAALGSAIQAEYRGIEAANQRVKTASVIANNVFADVLGFVTDAVDTVEEFVDDAVDAVTDFFDGDKTTPKN